MEKDKLRELTQASVAESGMRAALEAHATKAMQVNAAMKATSQAVFDGWDVARFDSSRQWELPEPVRLPTIWEAQAELFMQGLKTQVEQLGAC